MNLLHFIRWKWLKFIGTILLAVNISVYEDKLKEMNLLVRSTSSPLMVGL
jgi:hypothetical protein